MAEKIFFANPEKEDRAKAILALILGDMQPRDAGEQEKQSRFGKYLNEAKLDPAKDKEKAVRFIYEMIGGLLWSEADIKEEKKRVEESKLKAKKKAIE